MSKMRVIIECVRNPLFAVTSPVARKTKMPQEIFPEASKVIPLGLEPRTHTLKVYCSTN